MAADQEIAEFLATLQAGGFEYLRFELPDLHGTARAKTVPLDKVEPYLRTGLNFYGGTLALDTASMVVPGSGLHEETKYADSKLFPDFASLTPVPWQANTARVVCDVFFADDSPIEAAPRRVLARLLDRARTLGFDVMMGHEFEFYLLDAETKEQPFQGLHIFNALRNDYLPLIREMVDQLRAMGVDVITANAEYGGGQYEINFGPAIGLAGADKAYGFKNAAKEIAHRHGCIASFMSKPWNDKSGSGCHVHLSLWNRSDGTNGFLDPDADRGLSETARRFVAGTLAHAPAMIALTGPTPNCYDRLKPHTFAPSNVSWGIDDRTALVRVKATGDDATHLEMRGGAAVSNPYISAAASLAAGLLGIEDGLDLAPEYAGCGEDDPNAPKLPGSLEESLDGLEADGAMRAMLGEAFIKLFVTVKRFELARFRSHVTQWERDEYLEIH